MPIMLQALGGGARDRNLIPALKALNPCDASVTYFKGSADRHVFLRRLNPGRAGKREIEIFKLNAGVR
jgi:hypothetical protein